MAHVETTYTLKHDDVLAILCDYFNSTFGISVKLSELKLDLQEYRLDEGYGGRSGDQPARINRIWVTK